MNRQSRYRSFADLAALLPVEGEPSPEFRTHISRGHDGKGKKVSVTLDTKGRKGKKVTIISGLQHNPDTMEMIARTIKQICGCGGTVRDREIEIQGDQRERVTAILKEMNYVVQ